VDQQVTGLGPGMAPFLVGVETGVKTVKVMVKP